MTVYARGLEHWKVGQCVRYRCGGGGAECDKHDLKDARVH